MIHKLSAENKKKALRFLKRRMNGKLLTHINSCVHCGLCGESCHYFLTNPILKYLPGYKIEQISKIYRRYFTLPGKWIPKWVGAKDLDVDSITELIDVLYGACTMCGRCSLHCSIGVDIAYLIRTGRSMLAEIGCVPGSLQSTVDAAINTGNNMGIPRNDLVDTLRWLEEELQSEVEDENATIPLDKQNRRILYTLNPREPKFFPLSISAIAKIFYSANEDWTISSHVYDVTNYAYFSGNESEDRELVKRLAEETKKLHTKHLVLAECGHGYRAFRWEGTSLYGRPYPFHVQSVIELIAEYIRSGRIKLDSTKNILILLTMNDSK